MDINPINDDSFLIKYEDEISVSVHMKVKFYYDYILKNLETLSVVSGYNSILVTYDSSMYSYIEMKENILKKEYVKSNDNDTRKVIHVPVCYDELFGIDINRVAEVNQLTVEEVIRRHTDPEYLVYMIGFSPGFPYLGGMDKSIETPRLEVPRTKVEAGSVGIGGKQTGIYPSETPGGWNIIGKTPLSLFDIKEKTPSLLQMGCYIKFNSISLDEFNQISIKVKNKTYTPRIEG